MTKLRAHGRALLGSLATIVAAFVLTADATANPQPRIVGGTLATQPWPAHAEVVISDVIWGTYAVPGHCGGTLVAPTWVLTAGHCASGFDSMPLNPSEITITLGSTKLNGAGGTNYQIARVLRHPQWDSAAFTYDAALLELATPATQEPLAIVGPADAAAQAPGKPARIIGWGSTSDFGDLSPDLRQADVVIRSDADCNDANSYDGGIVGQLMLCAGYPEGGADACQGDSGGPLMVNTGTEWKLAGITSWGEGCGAPNKYGVYTEVAASAIRNWIAATAGLPAPAPAPDPVPPPPPPPGPAIPTAAFKVSGKNRVGQKLSFKSTSTHPAGGPAIVAFAWDLDGDGQYDDATGKKVKRSFSSSGSFTVGLQVTDDDGDTATARRTVTIKRK